MLRVWENKIKITACSFLLQIETLDTVKKVLVDNKPESFEDCVKYARLLWQENYSNSIQQLLYNFPADQVSYFFK